MRRVVGKSIVPLYLLHLFESFVPCPSTSDGFVPSPSNCPINPVGFGTGHSRPPLGRKT